MVLRGHLGAIDRFIRLSARRAALNGLDHPTAVAFTDPSGEQEYGALSDEERKARIIAIFERARARRDAALATQAVAEKQ